MERNMLADLLNSVRNYDVHIFEEKILEIMAYDQFPNGIWNNLISSIIDLRKIEPMLFLLEQMKINLHDERYGDIFLKHSVRCDYKMIKILVDSGLNINKRISNEIATIRRQNNNRPTNNYLICFQCARGNYDVVKLLIENGAKIDIPDNTALRAAARGQTDIVQLIIESGADVNIENGVALKDVTMFGYDDIIKLLLAAGLNIKLCGGEALIIAVDRGYYDTVKLLLDQGVDINYDNCSALATAIHQRYHDIIDLLLKNGASVDIFNSNKMFDIYSEEFEYNNETLNLLYENGVNPLLVMHLLWIEHK